MALSYKVFPGTPYYSNTSLTTKAGEIVNTTAATYVNTTYGTVSVGGSTYYVAYGMMVSFWNSSFTGAQIDDALNKVINADTTPTANSTKMITSGGVKSALVKTGTYTGAADAYKGIATNIPITTKILSAFNEDGYIVVTTNGTNGYWRFQCGTALSFPDIAQGTTLTIEYYYVD